MFTDLFHECYDFLSANYAQVSGYDFYREIFPDNENSGEFYTDYSHPNSVYLYQDSDTSKKKFYRRIMLNDTWERDYIDYVEHNSMALCSGLSYRGRYNHLTNAQKMHALIFDLDGVGYDELMILFLRFGGDPSLLRRLPTPTFLVLSGSGVHIYYVFDEPIDLFPNIKLQLKNLKYDLTFRIWEYKATSKVEAIQYQSINQGFRMVGSLNSKYGNEVVAFRIGDRVNLDLLNLYVNPVNRVDLSKPFKPSQISLDVAKESYPDWYQRVIVAGNKKHRKWDISGKVHGKDPFALYHWWLRQASKVKGGHRYFYLMCLVIYAYKCDVPKAKLEQDMNDAFEILKKAGHTNPLTEDDIISALEAYDKEYYNFTIKDIELLTDIRIDRNKRNYQKQSDHLEEARAIRDIRMNRQGRSWRNTSGAPNKSEIVALWRLNHPDGKKVECARDLSISRVTVDKWWNYNKSI